MRASLHVAKAVRTVSKKLGYALDSMDLPDLVYAYTQLIIAEEIIRAEIKRRRVK